MLPPRPSAPPRIRISIHSVQPHSFSEQLNARGLSSIFPLPQTGHTAPSTTVRAYPPPVPFPEYFFRRSSCGNATADELFRAYSYPLPKMKTVLNGKNGQYGHRSVYEKDRYPTDELRNHYAYYYGGDYGEILIDNGSSRGRNLLLIADSYSNPINLLLASHFDRTCVIDLRYYEKDTGKPFDISGCISENRITDVLLLGDIAFFADAQEEVEN